MTAKEWLELTLEPADECGFRPIRPRAVCKDGFSVSIQGNTRHHYCAPREVVDWGYEYELGYPSERDETIMSYAEDRTDPTGTVYGFVPIDIIETLIQKHGGIVRWTP